MTLIRTLWKMFQSDKPKKGLTIIDENGVRYLFRKGKYIREKK